MSSSDNEQTLSPVTNVADGSPDANSRNCTLRCRWIASELMPAIDDHEGHSREYGWVNRSQ